MSASEAEEQEIAGKHGSRRNFLKLLLTLGVVSAVGSVASVFRVLSYLPPPAQAGPLAWPVVSLGNISSLDPTKPLRFNYPLVDTPAVLLKCGVAAENGVGPDSDIVAFSNLCQHLGCVYATLPVGASPPCNSSFVAPIPQGYCCCHGGQYDFLEAAKVVSGPPPRPVPQVVLKYDSSTGDISAVSMAPPTIFGKGPPGTMDPALVLQYDLAGGDLVTQATVFSS